MPISSLFKKLIRDLDGEEAFSMRTLSGVRRECGFSLNRMSPTGMDGTATPFWCAEIPRLITGLN